MEIVPVQTGGIRRDSTVLRVEVQGVEEVGENKRAAVIQCDLSMRSEDEGLVLVISTIHAADQLCARLGMNFDDVLKQVRERLYKHPTPGQN